MLFNSPVFIFYFLPLVLVAYKIIPHQFRNFLLTASSLVFFAWGGVSLSLILIVSCFINYLFGYMIHLKRDNLNLIKWLLGIGISLNLGILVYYKYAIFFLEIFLNLFTNQVQNSTLNIILPVGISFYTFQGLSYLIDVYRNHVPVQKNYLNLLLYIALFPQLIAGPIIRYEHIEKQLIERKLLYSNLILGLERFIIGLTKKVIVANTFAFAADKLWNIQATDIDTLNAWLALFCYAFQIYTDFSAYSDMAIGLSTIFGFKFPENFNFPYIANSMKDFWSRWHISLSSWFRDYLYIPLGGNRKGKFRTYLNLILVFFCTGFWHGAGFNFIIWGMYHGFFLLLERILGGIPKKIPNSIKTAIIFFIVLLSWVPFRATDVQHTKQFFMALAGLQNTVYPEYNEYMRTVVINNEFIIIAFISLLFIFALHKKIWSMFKLNFKKQIIAVNQHLSFIRTTVLFFLFVLCTMYIIAGSYSPFIYFRF